ncbi:hypothetical protein [Streptomyces sp. NPDC020742]|uniref:hypothetical protein n=1 Tax=unclassified Streptomyces TaxID=2593676 RepID=UPI0033FEE67C
MSEQLALIARSLLVDVLTVLAAAPAEQVAWMERHDVEADDLAIGFDHDYQLVPTMVAGEFLDPSAVPDLRAIDGVLDAMSGPENAARWTTDALATDPGWSRVRTLARQVLVCLNGDWRLPMPTFHADRY